jgi:hypothetical protein
MHPAPVIQGDGEENSDHNYTLTKLYLQISLRGKNSALTPESHVRFVRSGGTQFENYWSKAKITVDTLLKYEESRGVKMAISLCRIKNRIMTARHKTIVGVWYRQSIGWSLCWSSTGQWTWHTYLVPWFTVLWLRQGNVTFTFPLQYKLSCCSL